MADPLTTNDRRKAASALAQGRRVLFQGHELDGDASQTVAEAKAALDVLVPPRRGRPAEVAGDEELRVWVPERLARRVEAAADEAGRSVPDELRAALTERYGAQ